MSELEKAQARFDKVDKLYKGTLIAFGIAFLLIISVTLFQIYTLQSQIANNQKINTEASSKRFQAYSDDNQRLHLQTQQYVKCIALTLLQPIQERTQTAFDQCSNTADTTKKDNKGGVN